MSLSRLGRGAVVAALVCAALALVVPAGFASAPARTTADTEGLVSYLTFGKLKPGKRVAYQFVCSTACQVTTSTTLVLRGAKLGPAVDTGMFTACEVGVAFVKPNGAA